MRLLLTIFIFISLGARATVYYVDNAGSDGAAGTSTGTAWQTIAHVNAQTFAPGDQILFKRDGSWNERLNVQQSGTSGNPITFGAYGTGAKPIITGFQNQTGFTNSGNIWTATATNSVKQLNTVLVNGALAHKARTPNTGWLLYSSPTTTSILTSLTGTPNYTGSEAVVRVAHWVIDIRKISSQSSGTLNFSQPFIYDPAGYGGTGFFIQNTVSDLDTLREFQYDSASKVLKVYATSSPTVQISTIDTLVYTHNKQFITFDGIAFTGANKAAIKMDTVRHLTATNCTFLNNGAYALSGQFTPQTQIVNDTFINTQSTAIHFRNFDIGTPQITEMSDSIRIDGNYFLNTGAVPGMNTSGNGQCMALTVQGSRDTIVNNRIDSTGYIPIYFTGRNCLVAYNYITNYCFVKDDGGGVYTYAGAGIYPADMDKGSVIRSNIIGNGIGATVGTQAAWQSAGVYCDIGTRGVLIDSNTTFNTNLSGMFADGGTDSNRYVYNTVIDSIGTVFTIINDGSPFDIDVVNNVFYSKTSANHCIYLYTDVFKVDSNHYLCPASEIFKMNFNGFALSLADWQEMTGYDANGAGTPVDITSGYGILYTNPQHSDSTIMLPAGNFVDARGGTYYAGSTVLHGYGSVLMFPSTTPPEQPVLQYFPRRSYRKIIQQ